MARKQSRSVFQTGLALPTLHLFVRHIRQILYIWFTTICNEGLNWARGYEYEYGGMVFFTFQREKLNLK